MWFLVYKVSISIVCEASQIQCGGKIEDLSAFWKTISRVEQEWRDTISEMDQENFAEVDRDNCALKLTQRRKNRGKVIRFYSSNLNKTCT